MTVRSQRMLIIAKYNPHLNEQLLKTGRSWCFEVPCHWMPQSTALRPGTKTFIDCDDLNDLTRLFSYVGQDRPESKILDFCFHSGLNLRVCDAICFFMFFLVHLQNIKTSAFHFSLYQTQLRIEFVRSRIFPECPPDRILNSSSCFAAQRSSPANGAWAKWWQQGPTMSTLFCSHGLISKCRMTLSAIYARKEKWGRVLPVYLVDRSYDPWFLKVLHQYFMDAGQASTALLSPHPTHISHHLTFFHFNASLFPTNQMVPTLRWPCGFVGTAQKC